MHCTMIPIAGQYFKGKPVYKCTHCGLTVGLEKPETRIICPVRSKVENHMNNMHTKEYYRKLNEKNSPWEMPHDEDIEMKPNMSIRDRVKHITKRRLIDIAKQEHRLNENNPNNDKVLAEIEKKSEKAAELYDKGKNKEMAKELGKTVGKEAEAARCSQEEIDARLAICDSCEYYENDTCLQCGCAISRDRVFGNKLAYKDKECPIGKWGRITNQIPMNGEKDTSSGSDSDSGGG